MRLYRFRVLIDDKSEAFRDIEIKSEQTFLDLHNAIKQAFGFEGSEMACFYVSDEDWSKGPEIPLADMGFAEDGAVPPLMAEVTMSDHMRSTRQRFIYAYDFLHMWMFLVEMIEATEPVKGKRYPRVAMSIGQPPSEHSRVASLAEGILEDEPENGMTPEATEVFDADEDQIDHLDPEGEEHDEGGHGHDMGLGDADEEM